jgi:hypothetical protein
MSVDRDWRIAVHESGHALLARPLGLPGCGEASVIEPNAHAHFPLDHGAASVCALMAGAAAEIELLGDYDSDTDLLKPMVVRSAPSAKCRPGTDSCTATKTPTLDHPAYAAR